MANRTTVRDLMEATAEEIVDTIEEGTNTEICYELKPEHNKAGNMKGPMYPKLPRCSICGRKVDYHADTQWSDGHNAWPLNQHVGDGRACNWCNTNVVMPARAKLMGRPGQAEALIAMAGSLPHG